MAKADERTASELEATVLRLTLQRDRLDQLIAEYKAERQRVLDELNRTQQLLQRRRRGEVDPTVSSHALLRYLERILEIDVGMLEQQILSPASIAAIRAGATRISVNGVGLVIRDRVVVTVVEE